MKANMVFFSLVLGSLIAGCSSSTSYHVSKDYRSQAPKLKKVGVVIAQTEILNLGLGNYTWPDFEKSAQSKKFFESAAVMEFNRKGYAAVLLPIDDDLRALIKQYDNTRPYILYLYSTNIITGNPMAKGDKGEFDTIPSLKSTVPVLTRAGVDAIAIIWASSQISTSGRTALSITTAVFGVVVPHGKTYGELALLDKSGKIVFFKLKKGKNYNLTEEDSVSRICSELVSDLEAIKQ